MKYYLYLDDSNKFEKDSDAFTLYSFILLNKEQRMGVDDYYQKKWANICKDSGNHDYDINKFSKDEKLMLILKEIKGNDFIEKYNRSKHRNYRNAKLESQIDEFVQIYSLPETNGTIVWCKKCSTKIDDNFKDYDQNINRKQYLLLVLLKKLLDEGVIKETDQISIYLDEEFSKYDHDLLGDKFKNYLNKPINEDYNITGAKTNPMIYKLRKNKIVIKNVKFLSSITSVSIRLADIIANMSNKILSNKLSSWVSSPSDLYTKIENGKFIWIKFPHFIYTNDVEDIKNSCPHFK
jgi:hypothetical protein